MSLTDWFLLGWTAVALFWLGGQVTSQLRWEHRQACQQAYWADQVAESTTDLEQARLYARRAESWRGKAIWPCATGSVE